MHVFNLPISFFQILFLENILYILGSFLKFKCIYDNEVDVKLDAIVVMIYLFE